MSGKKSRNKGAAGEREAAKYLAEFYGPGNEIKRNLSQYQWSSGRDLDGTEPFCIQVKRTKGKCGIEKALDEAMASTDNHYHIPVAMTRSDKGEWLFTMLACDFFFYAEKERIFGRDLSKAVEAGLDDSEEPYPPIAKYKVD